MEHYQFKDGYPAATPGYGHLPWLVALRVTLHPWGETIIAPPPPVDAARANAISALATRAQLEVNDLGCNRGVKTRLREAIANFVGLGREFCTSGAQLVDAVFAALAIHDTELGKGAIVTAGTREQYRADMRSIFERGVTDEKRKELVANLSVISPTIYVAKMAQRMKGLPSARRVDKSSGEEESDSEPQAKRRRGARPKAAAVAAVAAPHDDAVAPAAQAAAAMSAQVRDGGGRGGRGGRSRGQNNRGRGGGGGGGGNGRRGRRPNGR